MFTQESKQQLQFGVTLQTPVSHSCESHYTIINMQQSNKIIILMVTLTTTAQTLVFEVQLWSHDGSPLL